jgi:hypothetical protein
MAAAALQVGWQTNIVNYTIEKIFALSDIHGDMHALIIALRDCAKVIKKKQNSRPTNPNILDMETEELLELDLNEKEALYIDDLNYEWCVNNNRVVICGDILDGYRYPTNFRQGGLNSKCPQDTGRNTTGCIASEYPQIEIKIYRFINALNTQAIRINNNCMIHKVLGNHELWNMATLPGETNPATNYIPQLTRDLGNMYYQGISRLEYFSYNKPGFDLILKGGAGIFLKINNNIFVHGQLDHNLSYAQYEKYNKDLNTPSFDRMRGLLKNITLGGIAMNTVWGRGYDRQHTLESKIQFHKCVELKSHLENFLTPIPDTTVENVRIIIGHCPQSLYAYDNILNSSFTNYELDRNIEILSGNIRTSFRNPNENFVFGIGMECDKTHLDNKYEGYEKYYTDHLRRKNDDLSVNPLINYNDSDTNERFIYKVDVAASRGFDINGIGNMPRTRITEKQTLGSRVPQVLEIDGIHGTIKIRRSTIRNMRIHQPREVYENTIIQQPIRELDISDPYYTSRVVPKEGTPALSVHSVLSDSRIPQEMRDIPLAEAAPASASPFSRSLSRSDSQPYPGITQKPLVAAAASPSSFSRSLSRSDSQPHVAAVASSLSRPFSRSDSPPPPGINPLRHASDASLVSRPFSRSDSQPHPGITQQTFAAAPSSVSRSLSRSDSRPHPGINPRTLEPPYGPPAKVQQLQQLHPDLLPFYERQAIELKTSVGKYAEAHTYVTSRLKRRDGSPQAEQDYIKERDRQIKEYIIIGGPNFQMKYMKYKLKYLQLKKL